MIAVLPFVSFSQPIMRLPEFLIFASSALSEATDIDDEDKAILQRFIDRQQQYMQGVSPGYDGEVTFIVPTAAHVDRSEIELLSEVLFFVLHKGSTPTTLLGLPSVFCREDFRTVVLGSIDHDVVGAGRIFSKTRYKYRIFISILCSIS